MLRQRQPRYVNKKLTDLAHEAPCMAQFPHTCNGPSVPAHDNSLSGGHGAGLKSHDYRHAAVCPAAHDLIDGRAGGWSLEEKRAEWDRAYIATWHYYWTNGKVTVK